MAAASSASAIAVVVPPLLPAMATAVAVGALRGGAERVRRDGVLDVPRRVTRSVILLTARRSASLGCALLAVADRRSSRQAAMRSASALALRARNLARPRA